MASYSHYGVRRDGDLSPKSKFHPLPIPTLPPTPPGSASSSPPPTGYFLPNGGHHPNGVPNGYGRGGLPAGMTSSEAGPSRRHAYEMPHTPMGSGSMPYYSNKFEGSGAGQQGNGYGGGYGTSGMEQYYRDAGDDYHPRGARRSFEPATGWEGTLSSAIASTIASVRTVLASDPSLDSSSPYPRAQVAFAIRRAVRTCQNLSASSLRFGLLCALWYCSSALSSNTGKVILNRFRYPVTLTIVQFGFVSGWCALAIAVREGLIGGSLSGAGRSAGGFWGIKRPNKKAMEGTLIMSLFQIAGHVFSSMAIARVPVSTVHTIKALSPLFTVLAYAGLFGVRYGSSTYVSLLPLTLGVMLACSFDLRANGIGFLCALGSTVIFVSSNIFGKKLLPKENEGTKSASGAGGASKMDKLTLLFYSSGMAFILMIPIWMWSDAGSLFSSWLSTSYDSTATAHDSNSTDSSSLTLAFYFLCNGSVHFTQCILAFSILARTSPVTYSIASLIKRIAVICLAIVWFGQKVSLLQAFGMCMTFTGLWMYNRAKGDVDKGERKRGQMERKGELLLPSNKEDARDLSGYDSSRANSPMPLYAGSALASANSHLHHLHQSHPNQPPPPPHYGNGYEPNPNLSSQPLFTPSRSEPTGPPTTTASRKTSLPPGAVTAALAKHAAVGGGGGGASAGAMGDGAVGSGRSGGEGAKLRSLSVSLAQVGVRS